MSAFDFYLSKGYTPLTKTVVVSGTNTVSVWPTVAGRRVVITDLSISTNPATTIAFYFDNGNDKIAGYNLAASSNISPSIGAWESTVASGYIFSRQAASQTDGTQINVTGFEIPVSSV